MMADHFEKHNITKDDQALLTTAAALFDNGEMNRILNERYKNLTADEKLSVKAFAMKVSRGMYVYASFCV